MTKVEWLKKQIKSASGDFPDLSASFLPKLIAAVEAAGEDLTRSDFVKLVESYAPTGSGSEHCEYMMLDTQLCYAADFSEVWSVKTNVILPEVVMSGKMDGLSLPDGLFKLGGNAEWIQDEAFPICDGCDSEMVLHAQFKSLPDTEDAPQLSVYQYGDMGNLYIFSCVSCNVFKVDTQCH